VPTRADRANPLVKLMSLRHIARNTEEIHPHERRDWQEYADRASITGLSGKYMQSLEQVLDYIALHEAG
jgi:hypothetical protein